MTMSMNRLFLLTGSVIMVKETRQMVSRVCPAVVTKGLKARCATKDATIRMCITGMILPRYQMVMNGIK